VSVGDDFLRRLVKIVGAVVIPIVSVATVEGHGEDVALVERAVKISGWVAVWRFSKKP